MTSQLNSRRRKDPSDSLSLISSEEGYPSTLDLLREISELKQNALQQQANFLKLEKRLSMIPETNISVLDKVEHIRVEFNSFRSFPDVSFLEAVSDHLRSQFSSQEATSQIARSVFNSNKDLESQVMEVREMSCRALYSAEVLISSILAQGHIDLHDFPAPGIPG